MKVINDKKRLLFTLKEKTSGPLVVAPEELILVEESLQETPTPVDSRPYKVYTALLTQSGTNAPVATVLENTLGDIVWSYFEVGAYFGTISNEGFVNDKTIGFVSNNASTGRYVLIDVYGLAPDQIRLQIKNSNTNLNIDGISGQPIEIRVYN